MKLYEVASTTHRFLTNVNEIHEWVNTYVQNANSLVYTIDPDTGVVNANGNVKIMNNFKDNLLPVKFGRISHDFSCIKSNIVNLHGCPDFVGVNFDVTYCNEITNATGGPVFVGGTADYSDCTKLNSFIGMPKEIHRRLCVVNTAIPTMSMIHKHVKILNGVLALGSTANKLTGGMLGLMLVRKLTRIAISAADGTARPVQALNIINEHLAEGRSGPDCQIELIDAGLAEFAKL